jgi:hypothetical protein
VIACILINLQTGKKPDKALIQMLGFYLLGLATEQDVIDHLNKPDNTGVKSRESRLGMTRSSCCALTSPTAPTIPVIRPLHGTLHASTIIKIYITIGVPNSIAKSHYF